LYTVHHSHDKRTPPKDTDELKGGGEFDGLAGIGMNGSDTLGEAVPSEMGKMNDAKYVMLRSPRTNDAGIADNRKHHSHFVYRFSHIVFRRDKVHMKYST
jgi:hypothetical protein